jgi:hypothetical protein
MMSILRMRPLAIAATVLLQAVVAALKPTRFDHSPRSVRDDLSHPNALVLERSRKLVLISVCDRTRRHYPAPLLHGLGLRLNNGWGAVRRLARRRWCKRLGSWPAVSAYTF